MRRLPGQERPSRAGARGRRRCWRAWCTARIPPRVPGVDRAFDKPLLAKDCKRFESQVTRIRNGFESAANHRAECRRGARDCEPGVGDDTYQEVNLSAAWRFLTIDAAIGTYDNFDGPTQDYQFYSLTAEYKGFYGKVGLFEDDFDGSYFEAGYV